MRIFDPESDAEPKGELLEIPPKKKKSVRDFSPRNKWTLVARGRKGRGFRFMFAAGNIKDAHKKAGQICREEKLEFVAIFQGHMAALQMA